MPDLSDPEYARFAWARYRRLMWWMTLASLAERKIAEHFEEGVMPRRIADIVEVVMLAAGREHEEQDRQRPALLP